MECPGWLVALVVTCCLAGLVERYISSLRSLFEGQSETDGERVTDRQTDRQTGRQAEIDREANRDRQA